MTSSRRLTPIRRPISAVTESPVTVLPKSPWTTPPSQRPKRFAIGVWSLRLRSSSCRLIDAADSGGLRPS